MGATTCFLLFALTVKGVVPRNRCACVKKAQTGPVNECANPALNNCDQNAACQDLPDGFSCTCNAGFTGDGTTCTALVNECANPALNNCDQNAACQDLPDGFSCMCNAGFTGDGTTCTELCNGVLCEEGENRVCYMDQSCVCIPGFHDDPGAVACVQTCDDYALPFIIYPNTLFACTPVIGTTMFAATLADCLSPCEINPNCISGIYDSPISACLLFQCDPLMGVTTTPLIPIPGVTYFVKSCAP